MVPDKDNPCWKSFILSDEQYEFQHLMTQLMYSQIKLILQQDQSEASVNAAAQLAHDFFLKNEKVITADLKTAIGDWEET